MGRTQRYSQASPCPICGGWATLPPHRAQRCWGFISSDGQYAYCTRPQYAGALSDDGFGHAHWLAGGCRCGRQHGAAGLPQPPAPTYDAVATALRIWGCSHSAEGTLVATYLARRGLIGPIPPTLRYVPLLRHRSGVYLPAMVAAVTRWPGHQPIAVQRTWLEHDGTKANVTPNKMSLGAQLGGAVRLAAPGTTLVVAEGVETALSLQEATGLPAWAVLGAGCMPRLVLPPQPLAAELVIGVDADDDGASLHYAKVAQHAWRADGRSVGLAVAPEGMDFNDLLRCAP